MRTLDVAALLRDGDMIGVHGLIEPGPEASEDLINRLTKPPQGGQTARSPESTQTANSATGEPQPGQSPDEIEFEGQTHDVAGDFQAKGEYDDLLVGGSPPVGPAGRGSEEGGLPLSDTVDGGDESAASATTTSPSGNEANREGPELADLLSVGRTAEDTEAESDERAAGSTGRPLSGRGTNAEDTEEDLLATPRRTTSKPQDRDGFKLEDLLTFDKDDVLDQPAAKVESTAGGGQADLQDLLTYKMPRPNGESPSRHRALAERLAGRASSGSGVDAYRSRARQLHQHVVAREKAEQAAWEAQQRVALAAAEQARREEAFRQAQRARQREIARQQELWRRQQLARQQEAWRQQMRAQQIAAMQQQQLWRQQQARLQQQTRWPTSSNLRGPAPPTDGSILGPNYDPRPRANNPFLRR